MSSFCWFFSFFQLVSTLLQKKKSRVKEATEAYYLEVTPFKENILSSWIELSPALYRKGSKMSGENQNPIKNKCQSDISLIRFAKFQKDSHNRLAQKSEVLAKLWDTFTHFLLRITGMIFSLKMEAKYNLNSFKIWDLMVLVQIWKLTALMCQLVTQSQTFEIWAYTTI